MNLYVIRHGETDWNRQLRLQGREDIPLNESGKMQAYECGNAIQKLKVDKIVASPLERAHHTACIIANQLGVDEVSIDEDIIERDFGEASGLTYQEKNNRYPNKEIPGFEDTEHVVTRMLRAIDRYSRQYPDGHVLMVTHGGVIKAVITSLINPNKLSENIRFKNTCINVIQVEGDKAKVIDYNMEAKEFAEKYLNEERDQFLHRKGK